MFYLEIQMKRSEYRSIEELYPEFTPDELVEANDTVKRYVGLVWRIYSRLHREDPENLTKILLNVRFKHPRQ